MIDHAKLRKNGALALLSALKLSARSLYTRHVLLGTPANLALKVSCFAAPSPSFKIVAPYGFGISDFTAVGTLAWQVFKAAKNAPDSFQAIHVEVLSLYAVLKEAEETILQSPLRAERQMRIETVVSGCASVLSDLQRLGSKYESLGLQSKWTWDRIRWGSEEITELRARLISNVTMLMAVIRYGR